MKVHRLIELLSGYDSDNEVEVVCGLQENGDPLLTDYFLVEPVLPAMGTEGPRHVILKPAEGPWADKHFRFMSPDELPKPKPNETGGARA